MQVNYVNVLVDRGMAEKIAITVFEHEVDILKEVHGGGRVTIINDGGYLPVEIDPNEEYARLKAKYFSADPDQKRTAVEVVYRNVQELTDTIKKLSEGGKIAKPKVKKEE